MSEKDDQPSNGIELWTVEYTKSAERYNEIYKAVWQNFSYMAVLSGAFLTFGKDALGPSSAALAACVPLLVWYWATYEPLHTYGVLVEQHLVDLEAQQKNAAGKGPGLYTKLYNERFSGQPAKGGKAVLPSTLALTLGVLACIVAFVSGRQYLPWNPAAVALIPGFILVSLLVLWHQHQLRVQNSIRLCALLLHGSFFFLLGTWSLGPGSRPEPLSRLHFESGDLAVDFRGQPQQVKSALRALLADPMFQPVTSEPRVLETGSGGVKDSGTAVDPALRKDRGK